jgi:hypothetical protein
MVAMDVRPMSTPDISCEGKREYIKGIPGKKAHWCSNLYPFFAKDA